MTPTECLKKLRDPNLLDSDELDFEIELDDPVMAMTMNISLYKEWLNNIIHGYYSKQTGNRVTNDRKSRREFSRFMQKFNVTVEKDEDTSNGNHWMVKAGKDPENLSGISSLLIRETHGTSD